MKRAASQPSVLVGKAAADARGLDKFACHWLAVAAGVWLLGLIVVVASSADDVLQRLASAVVMPHMRTVHFIVLVSFLVIMWVDFLALLQTHDATKVTAFRLVLFVNCLPACTYALVLLDVVPETMDQFGTRDVPLRYLQWAVSTPTLLLLLDTVCRSHRSMWLVCALDVGMIATGWLASWAPYWQAWFTVSSLAFVWVMKWQLDTVRIGVRDAIHPADAAMLQWVWRSTCLTWCIFPVAWVLRITHVMSGNNVEVIVACCDLLAKLVHSSLLRTSGFLRLDRVDAAQGLAAEDVLTDTDTTSVRLGQMARMVSAAATSQAGVMKMESLGTLSHQLRTPLNAIVGYNAMLLEAPIDRDQKKSVYKALGAARQLERVITNVVTYSDHCTNGHLVAVITDFDIEAELDAILSQFAALVADSHIGVCVDMHPDVPTYVSGPRQHYGMIVSNLLDNAIKACSSHGGGRVTLRVAPQAPDAPQQPPQAGAILASATAGSGAVITTQVVDNGCGVKPTATDSIFEPYVRGFLQPGAGGGGGGGGGSSGNSSASNEAGSGAGDLASGVGLGLTVARALCRGSGGDVVLRRRGSPQQPPPSDDYTTGAAFAVTLPFDVASSPAEALRRVQAARAAALATTGDIKLMVGDPDLAPHFRATAEKLGLRVSVCPPSEVGHAIRATGVANVDNNPGVVVTTMNDVAPVFQQGVARLRRATRPVLVLLTPLQHAMLNVSDSSSDSGSQSSGDNAFPPFVSNLQFPFTARRVYKTLRKLAKVMVPRETAALSTKALVSAGSSSDLVEDGEISVNWRALVVDDVASNRLVLSSMLRKKFHLQHVDAACDGQEAIDKAATGHYDVIFMDIMMPRVDGVEATHSIRTNPPPNAPRPCIISITASDSVEQSRRCKEAGVDDQVLKPIRSAVLRGCLERVVRLGLVKIDSQPRPTAPAKTSAATAAGGPTTRRRRRRRVRGKPRAPRASTTGASAPAVAAPAAVTVAPQTGAPDASVPVAAAAGAAAVVPKVEFAPQPASAAATLAPEGANDA